MLELALPDGFHFPEDFVPSVLEEKSNFEHTARAVYYSFVTMLTLGYGDIYPVMAGPRFVSIFQALFGQVFLVVLVARLVGLHVAQSTMSMSEPSEHEDD